MKHLLLFTCLLICMQSKAQDDSRYLAGAVPVENGKVVFSCTYDNLQLSKDQLFNLAQGWLEKQAVDESNRIVFADREAGSLAFTGKQYIVFTSTALSLDRSMMSYRLIATCEEGSCTLSISGIRYEYGVSYKKDPEKYTAEEWITDENTLYKGKLNRITGKFRKGTIDFADETFEAFAKVLNPPAAAPQWSRAQTEPAQATVKETQSVVSQPQPSSPKEGFVSIPAAQIPATILDMLPASKATLSTASQKALDNTGLQWKGTNQMFGKTVAQIAVPENSLAYKALAAEEIFTLSFQHADAETPWLLMECRKGGETTEGSMKTIIGEIIQVWFK